MKSLSALLLSGSLLWGQASFGGYVKLYDYTNPHDRLHHRLGTRTQFRVEGDNGFSGYFAMFNAEQEAGNPDSAMDAFRLDPVEMYIDFHFDRAELRLGRQFIFWGAADWVNPTDVINPWDFLHLSSEVEDYRVPVLALNATYYWSQMSLQTVLIPAFTPTDLPLPAGVTLHTPDRSWRHLQGGVRLQSYLGETDLSLAVYRGFDSNPTLIFRSVNDAIFPPQPLFDGYYEPFTLVGGDFVRTWDQWALKGEIAYRETADKDGTDIQRENPYVESVLGGDYIFSDRLSINVQWIQKTRLHYSRSEEEKRIRDIGMQAYLTAPDQTDHSLSGRLSWSPLSFVTSQVTAVYNLKDQDSFLLAFVSWEPRDATAVTLGTVQFQGPAASEYGRLDQEDVIFLEWKHSF